MHAEVSFTFGIDLDSFFVLIVPVQQQFGLPLASKAPLVTAVVIDTANFLMLS